MSAHPQPGAAPPGGYVSLAEMERVLLGAIHAVSMLNTSCGATWTPPTGPQTAANANAQRLQFADGYMRALHQLQLAGARVDPAVFVPLEVLGSIDNGVNPDIFTRRCLDEVRNRADGVRGRMAAVGVMRDALQAQADAWDKEEAADIKAKTDNP